MKPMLIKPVLVLLVVLIGMAGCANAPKVTVAEAESRYLDYLKVGQTTREEVIVRFGAPVAVFENERILTYQLGLTTDRGFVNSYRQGANYGLTVVFDRSGRLEKYKLRKQ